MSLHGQRPIENFRCLQQHAILGLKTFCSIKRVVGVSGFHIAILHCYQLQVCGKLQVVFYSGFTLFLLLTANP